MNPPPDKPPDRIEQYHEFFAEYRRLRDSRSEEQLLVTMRRHKVEGDDAIRSWEFSIDMDALERFASYEVPEGSFSKPFDKLNPDRVERFKEYTAFFHAGISPKGSDASFVRLTYAKEKGDEVAVQPDMWVRQEALKEFAARGMEYERELGHMKRWYPMVRVMALGRSEGTGVVETLTSIEDKEGALERAQRLEAGADGRPRGDCVGRVAGGYWRSLENLRAAND